MHTLDAIINAYNEGIQNRTNYIVHLVMEEFFTCKRLFGDCMRQWNPDKYSDYKEVDRVNDTGFKLSNSILVARCVLEYLKNDILPSDYTNYCVLLDEAQERLGSWDLYDKFGWEYAK